MHGKHIGPEGAIMLAPEIIDNGALLVLSLKDNKLATKEGGKALARALANNSTLKELDVSKNNWTNRAGALLGDGAGFAQELAVGIKDNGAVSPTISYSSLVAFYELHNRQNVPHVAMSLSLFTLTPTPGKR